MVDAIESRLAENQWLGGQQPSKDDTESFVSLGQAPNVDSHPNAFAWYALVGRFTEAVRGTWAAAAAPAAAGVSIRPSIGLKCPQSSRSIGDLRHLFHCLTEYLRAGQERRQGWQEGWRQGGG